MNDTKPFWASKTLWLNLIAGIGAIAGIWNFDLDAETQTALVGGIMAVANIVLRLVTSKGVSAG